MAVGLTGSPRSMSSEPAASLPRARTGGCTANRAILVRPGGGNLEPSFYAKSLQVVRVAGVSDSC
eukprot:6466352-Amphidinium_carterae.1